MQFFFGAGGWGGGGGGGGGGFTRFIMVYVKVVHHRLENTVP